MIINDLSHLENIPDNQLILGGVGGLMIANAFVLGNSGYTSTKVTFLKTGFTVIGAGRAVAAGGYFAQASVKVAVASGS